MKSNFFSLISLLFLSFLAQANNKVGNGGDVIVCQNENSKKIRLLDFYEAEVNVENIKSEDPFDFAKQVLIRFAPVSEKLSKQYQRRVESLSTDWEYITDKKLVDISDSKHLLKPQESNCEVAQIAIRKSQALEGEKKFLIQKNLWDQLPLKHQAGLIVHEVVYEHFSKLGEQDSINVRKVTRLIFDKNTKGSEFWKILKQMKIPIYPTD